jgi:hypothetical protein
MIIPFLSTEQFLQHLLCAIVMQVIIMICMVNFAKRQPTDYDTKYMRRWRVVSGIAWFVLAFFQFFIIEKFSLPIYYYEIYGTMTPSSDIIQTGVSPYLTLYPNVEWGHLTFQQWLLETRIENVLRYISLGLYFILYKPSSVKKWVKVRKFIGYTLLLYFLPATINFHYFSIAEFASIIIVSLFIYFLTRTYKKDAVAPIAPESHVGYNGKPIEDLQPIEPEEKVQLEEDVVSRFSESEKVTNKVKNIMNRMFEKINSSFKMLSFENKVNIVLLSIALISCLISLGGFWYYCSYFYRDNGFYNQWLIASFISALFIGIWYYLNYQRFTIEQCRKYGVIFIIVGFIALISPFIALALLIAGTIMLKRVFDDKRHSNTNSIQNGNNEIIPSDNFDVNSLQLWIDGSLKDLQSVYLKDTLTSEQQLQAVIYLVSLLCYKPNAPTEQIIKYVSTKYSIPENILSQYIKDYRYYRTLLAEDILEYTSMVVCKLCIYKPEISLEQIIEQGKDNNVQKILHRFSQHKVITNNIAICSEYDKNNDTIANNGTYITRSLSIYLDEFEQMTIGLAYSMEILK